MTSFVSMIRDANGDRPGPDVERPARSDLVEVPARLRQGVMRALEESGITAFDDLVETLAWSRLDDRGRATPNESEGFRRFRRQVRHRVLTVEEEQALGERIDAGRLAKLQLSQVPRPSAQARQLRRIVADGRRAADELARHNLRLVIYVANRYRRYATPGLDVEDMIQEGYFGLVAAVDRFDVRLGFKFSTYAAWWIRKSIWRAIGEQSRTIRLPIRFRDDVARLVKAENALQHRDHRSPAVSALADYLGLSEAKVRNLIRWRQEAVSLDQAMVGDESALGDDIASDLGVPEQQAVVSDRTTFVNKLLDRLPAKERDVIAQRYGLASDEGRTLEAVGQRYGVCRERIRQIEAKGFVRLHRPSILDEIPGYFEN